MKRKLIRVTLGETKGSIATIETLEDTLKELQEISKLDTRKIAKEKKAELEKLKEDIKEMQIEIFEAEYAGMFEVKETLELNANELQEFVAKLQGDNQ